LSCQIAGFCGMDPSCPSLAPISAPTRPHRSSPVGSKGSARATAGRDQRRGGALLGRKRTAVAGPGERKRVAVAGGLPGVLDEEVSRPHDR
jgi:hypothetical protein